MPYALMARCGATSHDGRDRFGADGHPDPRDVAMIGEVMLCGREPPIEWREEEEPDQAKAPVPAAAETTDPVITH